VYDLLLPEGSQFSTGALQVLPRDRERERERERDFSRKAEWAPYPISSGSAYFSL